MPVHSMLGGSLPYHGSVVAAGNGRSAPVSLYAYATPQATPRLRSVPHFRLRLGLSDHLKVFEEGLDTDRLRIINSTSLRLWITCRAKVLSNVRAAGPFDEMATWAQFTSGGTATAGTDAKEAARMQPVDNEELKANARRAYDEGRLTI